MCKNRNLFAKCDFSQYCRQELLTETLQRVHCVYICYTQQFLSVFLFHKMGSFDSVLKLIPLGPLSWLIYLLRLQPFFFSPCQLEDLFIISNVYTVTRLDGKHHLVWFGIIFILTTIFFNTLHSSLKLHVSEIHMGKNLLYCNLDPMGRIFNVLWSCSGVRDHTVDAPKRIVLWKILINTILSAMEEIVYSE